MKAVVADCSIIIPWYFPEKNTGIADKLKMQFHQKTVLCHSPSLLTAEFGNVAWKKIIRGECDIFLAIKQLCLFLITGIHYHDCRRLVADALAVGHKCNITVYDSLYLVLAKTLDMSLATLDERLNNAANSIGVQLYQ